MVMKNTILLSLFFVLLTSRTSSMNIISIKSPAYCSDIQGNKTISISAPNFSQVTVYCWKQGDNFGTNTVVGKVVLDAGGAGSINFPADVYPHGPITLRISGTSATNSDNCYLQLYNTGGVSWNEGVPVDPPAAAGMNLVFADDFNKADLSIGSDAKSTTYYDHKPPFGSQDFSSIPFTSFSSPNNPFSQAGSYLRIRADANKNSAGLISSTKSNKTGFKVQAPCYFESRFIAPNAPGTWAGIWLLSLKDGNEEQCDELDIIECYGGEGTGKPNSGPVYAATPHAWGQPGAPTKIADDFYRTKTFVNMYNFGIPSTWYESPHIYGCKVGLDYTIYYCDNIEIGRHETLPISKTKPFYFMMNLATGGGWPVDLSRYNGIADMYVDYVRVYSGTKTDIETPKNENNTVNIYPNPVTSETAIHLKSVKLEEISVCIYNVLGQSVLTYHTYEQGEIKIPIDMLDVSNGTYLAKICVGELQFNKTIIK